MAPGPRAMSRRALVRPPSPAYARCLRSDRSRAIDVALALRQHAAYVEALRAFGVEVEVLPPEPDLPDACFVEDTAVVAGGRIAITRPGAPDRRPETESIARATGGTRMGRGRLDGGDVLVAGGRAFVGLSGRTDEEGAAELGRVLGIEIRAVPLRGFLHLKTAVTPLGPGRLLMLAGAFPKSEFAGLEIVETDELLGANVLEIDGRVLASAAAPRTARRLGARTLDLSEFHAGDAGLTCLSLIF